MKLSYYDFTKQDTIKTKQAIVKRSMKDISYDFIMYEGINQLYFIDETYKTISRILKAEKSVLINDFEKLIKAHCFYRASYNQYCYLEFYYDTVDLCLHLNYQNIEQSDFFLKKSDGDRNFIFYHIDDTQAIKMHNLITNINSVIRQYQNNKYQKYLLA